MELQQQRRTFVLAMADLDDFKRVNDDYGHTRGDEVLQAVSRWLLSSVRTTDLVGRVGGDEFVVILLDVTLLQAESRFRSVLKNLQVQLSGESADHRSR
jgi:diguanylate cyclase (GGDEF)-like protein